MWPVFQTGTCVVIDNGFYSLKVITYLHRRGVYSRTVIKKRRYWPKHITDNAIVLNFGRKTIGDIDAL